MLPYARPTRRGLLLMPDVNEIIDRLLDQMFGAPLPTGDPGRRFGVVHFEDAEAAVLAAFAAGRAAASPDPPDAHTVCVEALTEWWTGEATAAPNDKTNHINTQRARS